MNYLSRKKIGAIVFSLLVIASGILLCAFNTGILPMEYKSIVFSLPMLVIAIGFHHLFLHNKWVAGIVIMVIGGFFLISKIEFGTFEFIKNNRWALALIIIGIFILCKVLKTPYVLRRHCARHHRHRCNTFNKIRESQKRAEEAEETKEEKPGYIVRNCIFGGQKENYQFAEFCGGEINCVFGALELDLTDSQIAEGIQTLEINAVFGGVILFIPAHWKVHIQQNNIFGHFDDKREKPTVEVNENRTLIIRGSAVLGGGEIKSRKEK